METNSKNNYTITNRYTPEVTQVEVNKVWEDNNNQDGIRPEEIEVVLVRNNIYSKRKDRDRKIHNRNKREFNK